MGELYCLKVGCGDCSIIISEGNTYLVDCHGIGEYSRYLPSSKQLTGVFITHQHEDHFSGLNYLRDNGYNIDFLIYSPYERRYSDNSVTIEEWHEFEGLKDHFVSKGTKIRQPYRQTKWGNENRWWQPTTRVGFEIIGPHKELVESDTREINDASLVIKACLGGRSCLFTGDASDTSLELIARETNKYCGDILHASHHGSLAGAQLEFIKKAKSQHTVISTKSGVYSNVPHPTALQRYEANTGEKVYRTDTFGTVKCAF